ncbi:hypothetical protein ABPG74_002199 [Tetrahymena malaccensis]
MISIQSLKQIGNTSFYEIKLQDKVQLKVYITQQEISCIATYYQDIDLLQSTNEDINLAKIPIQGQIFLILNNIIDWRRVETSVIQEIIEQGAQDELQFLNRCMVKKLTDDVDELIEQTINFKSENKFINLQKDILLFYLYNQSQQYEICLKTVLSIISQLEQNEKENKFLFYLFNCYVNSSTLLSLHGRREEAIENLKKANSLLINIFQGEELVLYKSVVKINLANIKQDLFEFTEAQDILNQCLRDIVQIQDKFPYKSQRLMAQIHNNLSTCYQQEGDEKLDKSLEHSLISLQMNEAYFGNQYNSEIAKNLMNISSIYKDLEMFDQAISYSLKAEEIFQKLNDKENLPICLGMIASIYSDENIADHQKALEYSQKCVDYLEKYGKKNTIEFAIALHSLSRILHLLGQFEEGLKKCSQSLLLFQEMNEEQGQIQSFELISKIHKSLNNLDLAIDNLYDAIQLRQKLDKDNPTEELLLDYQDIALMWEEKGDTQESNYYVSKAKKLEKQLKIQDN